MVYSCRLVRLTSGGVRRFSICFFLPRQPPLYFRCSRCAGLHVGFFANGLVRADLAKRSGRFGIACSDFCPRRHFLALRGGVVAALAGVLAFAVVKFFAAARAATRASQTGGTETAFMAAAMQDALQQMRAQERAMKARAEASERLSGEIIASLTSGLLVVNQDGVVDDSTIGSRDQHVLALLDRALREVTARQHVDQAVGVRALDLHGALNGDVPERNSLL